MKTHWLPSTRFFNAPKRDAETLACGCPGIRKGRETASQISDFETVAKSERRTKRQARLNCVCIRHVKRGGSLGLIHTNKCLGIFVRIESAELGSDRILILSNL